MQILSQTIEACHSWRAQPCVPRWVRQKGDDKLSSMRGEEGLHVHIHKPYDIIIEVILCFMAYFRGQLDETV